MKDNVLIIVEGEADKRFLGQYIDAVFGVNLDSNFIVAKGWAKLIRDDKAAQPIVNRMRQCSDNNGVNLIVFDADNNPTERFTEITTWGEKNELSFELFLIPNGTDEGALEHLLEKAINQKNQPIFDCWQHYEDSLRSVQIEGRDNPLTIPAKKTKIYGYLEALLGTSKKEKDMIKERNRDYKNPEHWNLLQPYLSPLKEFFEKNLD